MGVDQILSLCQALGYFPTGVALTSPYSLTLSLLLRSSHQGSPGHSLVAACHRHVVMLRVYGIYSANYAHVDGLLAPPILTHSKQQLAMCLSKATTHACCIILYPCMRKYVVAQMLRLRRHATLLVLHF